MLRKCGLLLYAVLIFVLYPEVHSGLTKPRVDPHRQNYDWWKNGVFYQIYPRSFKEDDGRSNGIGNLKGIESKLGDLKEIGITAIILSQILKSSGTEHSEAILDFKEVHPEYGTKEDFEKLVAAAKLEGIKIILDLVINHSGKETQWFIDDNVLQTDEKEDEDFYVWSEGIGIGANRKPPNNWLSVYGDSAWELIQPRNEYYLHQFGVDEPDLNYHNPKVIEEMKGVLQHWLELGVDGFRLDAVPFLFEDKLLSNDTVIPGNDPYKYESLEHINTKDQDETYDLIYKLRECIDKYNNETRPDFAKILITEAYTSTENTVRYYGADKDRQGAHIPFNFLLLPHDKLSNATNIVESINEWLENVPEGQTANWLIGNHDHHRAATRFGPELADNMNILIASLPGVMITYNGEEIGQENGEVAYIQCKDPVGCKAGPADFPKVSRDFQRTPCQWSDGRNAGFSDGNPWLPVGSKFEDINLATQIGGPEDNSYHVNKEIIETRNLFKDGITVEALPENVIKITRGTGPDGYENHIILMNMGKKEQIIHSDKKGELYKVIYSSSTSMKPDDKVWAREVKIPAYKAIVFQVISKKANYDWWKNAVIYQVYPRSFKDSDNDGNGDLNGIIEKLPYLKELGVDVLWLSPIYMSPQVDQGYDIQDYKQIDPMYGTMKDFEKLVIIAEFIGIKIIMDFVPNHTSDKHQWFIEEIGKPASTTPNIDDCYVWHAGYKNDKGETIPPNNWISIFKGSAWTWNEDRKQFYLHQFDKSQPDLNYRNPKVKEEMEGVLKFWLDQGVSGFRMGAVPYLVEDESFMDEPRSNNLEAKANESKYLNHIYTSDVKETFDVIYEWREFIEKYTAEEGGDERIMMTEAYTDIYTTMYYYGNAEVKGAHFTFNFQLIEGVNGKSDAIDFATVIKQWVDLIPEGYTSNWVLGNHDKHRLATRFGPENLGGFNMLAAILPGVMVIYNGEEIGLENGEVTWEEGRDPSACNGPSEEFAKISRDFQRTPFHWDNSTNAGFNNGSRPWLPVSGKYKSTNLLSQINNSSSHFELYKRVKSVTDYVLTILRYHPKNDSYFHLFNLGKKEETFNLKAAYNETTPFLEVIESNDLKKLSIGTLLNSQHTTLQAHQSVIAVFTSRIPCV